MANILPREKQIAVIRCLTEGLGVRATERLCDVSRETVLSLLLRVGAGCIGLHNTMIRDLATERVEMDELWGFVGKKQKQVRETDDESVGDQWTRAAADR